MIFCYQDRELHTSRRICRGLVALLVMGLGSPAFCALGSTSDSVVSDASRMKAVLKVSPAARYSIHELSTPTGIVVREYVSVSGKVFGVAWQGPFVPEMKLLLGDYFEQYRRLTEAQRESREKRGPLNIQDSTLVVQTGGHMGAYSGRAYDPRLLPQGTHSDEIQ